MKQIIFVFMAILLTTGIAKAQGDGAVISIAQPTHDFGDIKEADGDASHVFIVKNEGELPLVVTRVIPSCGCTSPEWTKEPILTGKTGEIKITFNPKGRPGPFTKNISVYSNGKKGSLVLTVKGNVK